MNAPATFKPATWQDHRPKVRAVFPAAADEEIELRSRLLHLRDLAMGAMPRSYEESHYLLNAVQRMANRYALEPLDHGQLKELRRILVMATTAASSMQVLMNEINAEPAAEGQHGRG